MPTRKISSGTVHRIPSDMKDVLLHTKHIYEAWEDISPLARNEWICWVVSVKKTETRDRRIRIMIEKLASGKRRPCCWAGCPHREK